MVAAIAPRVTCHPLNEARRALRRARTRAGESPAAPGKSPDVSFLGKMAPGEIAQILKQNIGKAVHVKLTDGESLSVLVLNVDDEGFVYDLVPKDRTEYWTSFGGVLEITPCG